ncbi:MAG TPA: zinc ribbon domain-containing protein [Firmicutes bacterium]|jgi:putative FmdB family regulatory protein|nr:zinc ribbon domain-containing protein [Bacillota bacterium]
MPTYEYECKNCGRFETVHKMSEGPLQVCPHCGGKEIRKLISSSLTVIYKGSGFHTTDYRDASYKADASKDCAGSSSSCGSCSGGDCGSCASA